MDPQSALRVLDDDGFVGGSRNFGRLLVFVSDVLNARFQISPELITALRSSGARVAFKTKAHHDSFIAVDDFFSSSACTFLNHVGRSDDSEIYGICQDLSEDILRGCDFSGHHDVAADFEHVRESAALYAAEDWTIFLRSFLMLMEFVESEGIETVVLFGNLNFSLCMARCLGHAGVSSYVLRPTHIDDEKFSSRVRYNQENLHAKAMGKHPLNCDLKSTSQSIADDLRSIDLACIIRVTDSVYAQNIACLISDYSDLRFQVFDNFLVSGSGDVLPALCPSASNYIHANIAKGWSCFSDRICSFFSRQISESMSRHNGNVFSVNGREVHPSFFHYNSNNFLRSTLHSLTYYRLFRRVFKSARPALGVIVSPGRRIESRVAVVAARQQGIPTFDLQCGTITRSRRFWSPNVDHVLCNESESYRVFTGFMGVPAKQVHLVGSPRLDNNVAPYRSPRPPLDGRDLRVFLALQPLKSEITVGMVEAAVKACGHLGNCALVIGFHPRESEMNRAMVRAVLETATVRSEINDGPSLAGVATCDVCVTFFSFLGVEAFALGCHVVGLNVGREEWPFRLAAIGIAAEVHDASELEHVLRAIRDGRPILGTGGADDLDRRSRTALRDGMSTQRIRRVIQPGREIAPNEPMTAARSLSLPARISRWLGPFTAGGDQRR